MVSGTLDVVDNLVMLSPGVPFERSSGNKILE
jgi:hypothetical protein